MTGFSNFILEQDLLDIPLTSGYFTWSSNREYPTWSRMEAQYPKLIQKRLSRLCSDHFSILLDCDCLLRGPSYKYETMRLKSEEFIDRTDNGGHFINSWKSKLYVGS